ncbi:MAG TPA: hypothetical protein VGO24_08430, partial [Solirubrobacterales bacterium]|nr:hypothetical protein [Solirubrobacterales bacterium]
PAAVGIWAMPETVERGSAPRLIPQALHVPVEMRAIFIRASLAAFAGFAVLGSFTAVAPAFLAEVMGVSSHAVVGLVVFSVFAASTAGQISLGTLVPEARALPIGSGALIAGMALAALGLAASSLPLLIIGGLVAGLGQGLSFRAGLGSVNANAPPERRAEVASSFFVVAYVGISIPVVGIGLLTEASSLRTAGLVFDGVVAALAAVVLLLLARDRTA